MAQLYILYIWQQLQELIEIIRLLLNAKHNEAFDHIEKMIRKLIKVGTYKYLFDELDGNIE